MIRTRTGTLALALVLATQPPVHADSVSLKSSVRLGPDVGAVRLADVAELEGPRAEAHADLVVAERPDVSRLLEVDLADVRRALDDAGVHWGKLHLSGRRTLIRPAPHTVAAAPLAMTPVSVESDPAPTRETSPAASATSATDLVDEATLRGEIARHVVAGLERRPDDVRLSFAGADEEVLRAPTHGRAIEIAPLSGLDGDRFQVAVRAWADGRVVERHRLGGRALVRTEAASAAVDLARGQVVGPGDVAAGEQWMPPQAALAAAPRDEVVGRILVKRVRAGEPIRRGDLERPALVRRGDQVVVRCLVGGLVLSMKAEARQEGAAGDVVECRKLGERDTFLATVQAPGEVVVDLGRR